ncbi:hypothetical protein LCGC14_0694410 [marine sediment metagenome]|uniref:Uncharacterized protein n=1 Tax=marine sediment metagenome TaxID=412755 RepID=A0A0F9QPK2_9ZZZZ
MTFKYGSGMVEIDFPVINMDKCKVTVENIGCTEVFRPGTSHKVFHNGKLVFEKSFGGGIRQIRSGLRLVQRCFLGKFSGTLRQWTKNGTFYKEEFTYDCNSKSAYTITNGEKELDIFYPDGKKWFTMRSGQSGKISFNKDKIVDDYLIVGKSNTDFVGKNNYVTSHDNHFKSFDMEGNLREKGQYEFRQKVGEWLESGSEAFYLRGVEVSKQEYHAKPEELDVLSILKNPNAQKRAVLLDKLGSENLVKTLMKDSYGAKVIHREGDMELISIDLFSNSGMDKNDWLGDYEINFLKVVCPSTFTKFFLRVPPDIHKCEIARQWTFGIEARNSIEYNPIQFKKET